MASKKVNKAFKAFVEKEGHTLESSKEALAVLASRFNRGETQSFMPFEITTGMLHNLEEDEYPTIFKSWTKTDIEDRGVLDLQNDGTHYGFVHDGFAILEVPGHSPYQLRQGQYFCVSGESRVIGFGAGIVITRLGFNGMFSIGGPIEAKGRLRYIDGCTDTLLVPPVIKGDPCLNLLHFPTGIDQTPHTHPTLRIGMVTRGGGWCRIDNKKIELKAGMPFIIQPEGLHGFMTDEQEMTVIAWHPDTDVGPTHDDHPMINRTIVQGVSAKDIDSIRTKTL